MTRGGGEGHGILFLTRAKKLEGLWKLLIKKMGKNILRPKWRVFFFQPGLHPATTPLWCKVRQCQIDPFDQYPDTDTEGKIDFYNGTNNFMKSRVWDHIKKDYADYKRSNWFVELILDISFMLCRTLCLPFGTDLGTIPDAVFHEASFEVFNIFLLNFSGILGIDGLTIPEKAKKCSSLQEVNKVLLKAIEKWTIMQQLLQRFPKDLAEIVLDHV